MKLYRPSLNWIVLLLATQSVFAQQNIMQAGSLYHGIRDYREVMPGVLYRGGANNGHTPLKQDQLSTLCDAGMGTAIYLYTTGFRGPSATQCSKGTLNYIYKGWEGKGRAAVHQKIFDTIKAKDKPVFIHCWHGIHATGSVAATALMQFCDISAEQAVDYWKVGIAKKVQYPTVIQSIRTFKKNPKLQLTPEERKQYCPDF